MGKHINHRERSAFYQLIKYAWDCGCEFEVWSGEEEGVCYYKGKDYKRCFEEAHTEESASVHITKNNEREWVYVVWGNSKPEEICDCTAYGFVDTWTMMTEFGQRDMEEPFLSWELSRAHYHEKMEALSA